MGQLLNVPPNTSSPETIAQRAVTVRHCNHIEDINYAAYQLLESALERFTHSCGPMT